MRGARAVAWLMTAACVGCTTTERTIVREPTGVEGEKLAATPGESPVVARYTLEEDRVVVGSFDWAQTCRTVGLQRVEPKQVLTTTSDIGANVGWLVLGIAVAGGSVPLFVVGAEASTSRSCSTNAEGKESCGLTAQEAFLIGGALAAATGLAFIITGSAGLALTPDVKEKSFPDDVTKEPWSSEGGKSCGSAGTLAGTVLELRANGLRPQRAEIASDGTARFTLPDDPGPAFDGTTSAEVVVAELGAKTQGTPLSVNTIVGKPNLKPYAEGVAARRTAAAANAERAVAEADAHQFEGVIHGDYAAKSAFTTACDPTGEDVCFDAIDNDCDGLYDVGCGYQQGALQWTLAWRTGDDLDLHVVGPDQIEVFYGRRHGERAGLELDVDCLGTFGRNCLAQNVENIFTPRNRKPMEGTYRGWVEVFRAEAGDPGRPIEAMVGGRIGGKTFRMPLRLVAQKGTRVFFAFAIGADRDRDSVADSEDACPDVAGVWFSSRAYCGCPDQDMDGVPDSIDQCPDVAGVTVTKSPSELGCPKRYGKARLTSYGVEIDGTIQFAVGSAMLDLQSVALLRDVALVMRDHPEALKRLRIDGHTDSDGDELKNMTLSRDRVKSVSDHLVRYGQISATRLVTAWYGETQPKAPNDSVENRAKNRRVEFNIVDPKPGPQVVRTW